jgi:hypothetical protein
MISNAGRFSLLVGFLFALSFVAGCGRGQQGPVHASVSGTVKLDGKPIEQGSVLFTPAEGVKGMAAGGVIENGRYQLSSQRGPTLGMNRVEIHAAKKSGRKIPKPMSSTGEMIDEAIDAVAPQFNSQTTLRVEIKPGDNTADFEVASRK